MIEEAGGEQVDIVLTLLGLVVACDCLPCPVFTSISQFTAVITCSKSLITCEIRFTQVHANSCHINIHPLNMPEPGRGMKAQVNP